MKKQYTSHLCTFMGREDNLKILIPYIDKALEINAVDNYWFIDMTRKRSDHELIKEISSELNDKYPGRVHLYNSKERGKIIDNKEKLAEATKSWETFYKFLKKFKDNDIIAKCDDDTYYIDVETLKAAYDFRWNNKKPYLMHANAINNGITAYHANKQGIWKDKESSMYPTGGLTGPLFSHPDVACKHHNQFTQDMIADSNNIEKYKLGKNIQFCNRVSINFIFMLGKDRHELSKITFQDEYDTSCKYPQRENRPNVIIGDFTMAHHTYGVQEPVMEKLKTHIGYETLCEKLKDRDFEHKSINTNLNATTTIASKGKMLMRAWVEDNSFLIKNPETNEYISLENRVIEDKEDKVKTLKTGLSRSPSIKDACVFNIEVGKKECVYVNNSMTMLKTSDKEDQSFLIYKFYHGGYLEHQIQIIKKGNNFLLKSGQGDLYLNPKKPPESLLKNNPAAYEKMSKFLVWDKNKFEWIAESLKKYSNQLVPATIKRAKNFSEYSNDETTAVSSIEDLPDNNCPREWIWMVKDYVWEFIPSGKENTYYIKLVADDKPDMYLNYNKNKDQVTTGGKQEWKFIDKKPKYLQHVDTGLYLDIQDDAVTMSKKMSELAMCPQK